MKATRMLSSLLVVQCAFPMLASAQQPTVIKFSHVVAIDTPKGKAAEFCQAGCRIDQSGAVKVEVYANSTLYKDKGRNGGDAVRCGANAGAFPGQVRRWA